MPELPEVQTIVDDIRKKITGKSIIDIFTATRSIWRFKYPRKNNIVGIEISGVGRKGKYILIYLSNGRMLIIHLGMTGKLVTVPSGIKRDKHTHVVLRFEGFDIHYNDIRRFGFMDLANAESPMDVSYLCKLGPDPLEMKRDEFIGLLKSKKRIIKPLLMDQNEISGLGNIYSDEALYKARIHPRAISSRIGKRKLALLHDSMSKVLIDAIAKRGSSISNYVDGAGVQGTYQNSHMVYGKEGKPCERCGAKIKREIIGSRSAHYCPRCQRLN
jgi:formamidopyrimidine-DNA glycosylase